MAGKKIVDIDISSFDSDKPPVSRPSLRDMWKKLRRKLRNNGERKTKHHSHLLLRYIVKELVAYFFVMYLVFFLLFFMNQILLFAGELMKKRVPFADVVKLMFYTMPFVLAQSAPFATLTGFLMCLGRMMSDNEILIYRASGCSLGHLLLRPILVLGALISLFSFFMNDYLLPLGTTATRAQLRKTAAANPTMEIEPHSVKKLNRVVIVIGGVDGKVISDLVFFDIDEEGRQRIIVAERTEAQSSTLEGVSVRFDMGKALVLTIDRLRKTTYDFITSDIMSLNVFESEILGFDNTILPSEMTSFDLGKKIKQMRTNPDTNPQELNMNRLEFNKKFSLPFGSFFFAFLAMPLALMFGKVHGQLIGLVVGLVISFVYWAMMTVGIQLGMRNGWNGLVLMWFPDVTVGLASLVFYAVTQKK